ncbi:MAG: hypothetical protein CMJ46_16350 [Planctomyces sp.]|nr:hypothetical protein [Planctomyces sp.]
MHLITLFMQFDKIQHNLNGYSIRSGQLMHYWYLVAIPIIFLVIWKYLPQIEKQVKHASGIADDSPNASIFDQLCRLHHVNRHERKLIQNVAMMNKVADPARIFIDNRPLAKLKGSGVHENKEYAALYRKLYGDVSV